MSQAFHGGRLREAEHRFGTPVRLDFSVNTNAFWQPPALPPAVSAWAAATAYPDTDAGAAALSLAELHGLDPSFVVPTAGAIEGLYLAVRLFQGKRACIPQPAFADYARACRAADVRVQSTPLPPPGLHPEEAQKWAGLHFREADLVVLGNPNNPTGRLWPHLDTLLAAPGLERVHWIVDEAFLEFTTGHPEASLLHRLQALPRVLVLRALTKSWAVPGLRIGFAASADPPTLAKLRALQPPWPINGIAEAWLAAAATCENRVCMLQSLETLPAVREALRAALAEIPGITPLDSDANFLLVHSARLSARELTSRLGRSGILVRACEGFEALDPERYFRIAVRSPADNRELCAALAAAVACPVSGASAVGEPSETRTPSPAARAPAALRARPRAMRAISVLGTSSNSGKSWLATALCAWFRKQGLRVAPFKAQNMSNHSAVTPEGGEIGRAQAAQAEACGLAPSVHMNPILLKPTGQSRSQLVRLGRAEGHVAAADYYKITESLWPTVTASLEHWKARCDVLVLEGAGSPVELNLLARDLVNLRPVRHLDAKWLLVADIERGGVFAQAAGTWALLSPTDRARCCGLVVNKFRGDKSLFADAARHFAPHFGAPLLGTLPFAPALQPEAEDSLALEPAAPSEGEPIHWIRFPHLSNGQDTHPWFLDEGVRVQWVDTSAALAQARIVILPGSKDTLADLEWLRTTGLDAAILAAHRRGALILGVCGGYQMLGRSLSDPGGVAGQAGNAVPGLGLLPVETVFLPEKEVRTVRATFAEDSWTAYEIHMGRSRIAPQTAPLFHIRSGGDPLPSFEGTPDSSGSGDALPEVSRPGALGPDGASEGVRFGRVWGTYLHGAFESAAFRSAVTREAGIHAHRPVAGSFRQQRQKLYADMADFIEEHLNLEDLWRYVAH